MLQGTKKYPARSKSVQADEHGTIAVNQKYYTPPKSSLFAIQLSRYQVFVFFNAGWRIVFVFIF